LTAKRKPALACAAAVFFALVSAGCGTLSGKIVNGEYIPPLQNFSVTIPPGFTSGQLAMVQDSYVDAYGGKAGTATFSNVLGGLRSVWYFPIALVPDAASHGKDAYRGLFKGPIFGGIILPNIPRATYVSEEFIDFNAREAFFAVVDMPEGSNVAVGGRRQDAVRGFVVFATKDYFYMLVSQIERRPADARDFLLQQLNDFYRYIKFVK
jgi:hypothetical protein